VTLRNSEPNPNDSHKTDRTGGSKHIGDLISAALSLHGASLPETPEFEPPQTLSMPKGFMPASEIRKLFQAGEVEQAIAQARNLYEMRSSVFSSDAQSSVVALGNLLEYATRARKLLPDLHERLHSLEKHWQLPDWSAEREVFSDLVGHQEPLQSIEPTAPASQAPFYIMHTLPRLCEYSAQAGRMDRSLRELAESTLERLHQTYLFFDGEGERLSLKQDAAAAAIRAAAHIATWKMQDERPDLRSVRYIAKCGRDRLALFSAPLADHNFALFQLASGQTEDGLKTLEALVESPRGVDIDVRIASLDQLTGWYIRLKDLDSARASLDSLREALARDGESEASAVKDNCRVRAEEALRVRSYEKMLNDAEQR
jgi:hypothetical protein